MDVGETLELTSRTRPPHTLRRTPPGAQSQPRPGETQRYGGAGDWAPGALPVQREHSHPGAHDTAVESRQVVGIEPAGGYEVGEAQFGKVGNIAAGVKRGKDQVVVAARGETCSTTVKRTAPGITMDSVCVGQREFTPDSEAGSDRRKVRPWNTRASAGYSSRRAEIAQREQTVKRLRPVGRRRLPLGNYRPSGGGEC